MRPPNGRWGIILDEEHYDKIGESKYNKKLIDEH